MFSKKKKKKGYEASFSEVIDSERCTFLNA